jgi:hypothetical protein
LRVRTKAERNFDPSQGGSTAVWRKKLKKIEDFLIFVAAIPDKELSNLQDYFDERGIEGLAST